MTKSIVVVISGGLDSSTLLHRIHADYPTHDLHGISFNYGQRHAKELQYAAHQCYGLGATHQIVDMSFIGSLFASVGSKSSLISDEEVPDGHYAEESMKSTVVPNRNMMMMSIAIGYAVSLEADFVATGVHGGDHFIYPDCRPSFFHALNAAAIRGNEGFGTIRPVPEMAIPDQEFIQTPYIYATKNDIARDAFDLGVDVAQTWSCYKGGDIHCGTCGTCVERQEAIASTGYTDPTPYEDPTFWREALRREHV